MPLVHSKRTAMHRLGTFVAHLSMQPCADGDGAGVALQDVLCNQGGGAATILLNRPAALNALTGDMCRAFEAHLRSWCSSQYSEVASRCGLRVIVVKSASTKAFSAGGDVKGCSLDGRDGGEGPDVQFRAEYELMHWIRRSPIPQVSLIDGIVMGCGAGLAVNGRFRVVTERAVFAMPEASIGFFPDVGANWWLPRIPIPGAGRYIALTGARLNAGDLIASGLATHFVPSDRLHDLEAALIGSPGQGAPDPADVLAAYAAEADRSKSVLFANAADLGECFAKPTSVAAVVKALGRRADAGAAFAKEALQALKRQSPTSLKLIWEALWRGAVMDFDDVLRMEFRLAMALFKMGLPGPRTGDVYEGTRAMLVDKTGAPRWSPASLEEVSDGEIAELFGPPVDRAELRLGA